MITPMEIHNKEFKRKVRGYDQDEVDEFLDKIVIDYEKLYRENAELKDKINLQNEKMGHYINIENTLQNTLLMAQKASEEAETNAREKASIIIKNAERQAEKIIKDTNYQIIEIVKNKEELIKDTKIFKARIKTLLESQLGIIEEIDKLDVSQSNEEKTEENTLNIEDKPIVSQLKEDDDKELSIDKQEGKMDYSLDNEE